MHQDILRSLSGQVFVSVFVLQLHFSWGLSPLWDSVKTQVHQEYDVHEGNQVWVVRLDMGEHKSTDLVVGEDVRLDSRLILTCAAHHGPAEWVYSGDGRPEYTTNTTIENLSADGSKLRLDDMKGAKVYIATLVLGKNGLTTKDTGRYNCMTTSPETGLKYKTLSAFYHVYVPGEKLFIRQGGENVVYDLSKSAARIPCGVSNPKASVTLQKFIKGNLEFVPNEQMFYHPISGYYPKKDIPGTYLCTAGYNYTFELIYFTLVPAPNPSDLLYHKNVPYNKRKSTTKTPPRPEDLEWLIYSTPTKTSSKKPTSLLNPKPPKLTSTSPRPFYPYSHRTTTTYGPFYTFYGTQSSTTPRPTYPNRRKPSGPQKFNPNHYPDEILQDSSTPPPSRTKKPTSQLTSKLTTRPSSTNKLKDKHHYPVIPQEIISYRPVFNFFKDTSRPSTSKVTTRKPTSSKKTTQNTPETTPSSPTPPPSTRTTVRKYRPKTLPTTTEMPFTIPDTVICSQFTCGSNAECFVHGVYYEEFQEVRREPGCKCLKEYVGNPYLECYTPTAEMDEDTLYFNSSFRSPLLPMRLFEHPDGESSSDSSSSERQAALLNDTVGIIDM